MDKNTLIGLFLIGLVLIGYSYWQQPSAEELAEQQRIADSLATADGVLPEASTAVIETPSTEDTPAPEVTNDSLALAAADERLRRDYGLFYPSSSGVDTEYVIENDVMKAGVSSKGGALKWLELKEYKTHDQKPLMLFDEQSEMSFVFRLRDGRLIQTENLYFEAQQSGLDGSGRFTMRLNTDDPGRYLDLVYTLADGSYEMGCDILLTGMGDVVDFQRDDLSLHWSMVGLAREKSIDRERERSSVFYRYNGDDREYLSERSDDETELDARTNWVAFKQYFFSAIAKSDEGFQKENSYIEVRVPEDEEDTLVTKTYLAELTLPIEYSPDPGASFDFYFGPNKYEILKTYENDMEDIIDLGWGIFGWMNKWLVIPIFNLLEGSIASYGIIILILTIVIKLMLFPLTYKNYLSSAKMRVLKPEIEEINKKFEKESDPMKKQQAVMGLYRKSGVNPMAGCLPMLVQMPILYAMFRFFPASIELRQEPFLWADDLSSYDSILQLPFSIPFYGDHVSLFTLLMAVSTIFYTRMNSNQMPSSQPGMPDMRTIMYFFPIMMLFFFNSFASGLSYYYLLANLFTIVQMFVIKNFIIDEDKIHRQIKAKQKQPVKKSAFQQRMEEAAKKRGYPTR